MKITTERLPESRVLLQIEVDPERLEKAMNQAYRRVVTVVRVSPDSAQESATRYGRALLGRETLLQEALDRLVPEVYDEALKQEGIEPIDRPSLRCRNSNLRRQGDHSRAAKRGPRRLPSSIRIEPEAGRGRGTLVDDSIDQLRHRYATVEPVERPVELGDLVTRRISNHDATARSTSTKGCRVCRHAGGHNQSPRTGGGPGRLGSGESKEFSSTFRKMRPGRPSPESTSIYRRRSTR